LLGAVVVDNITEELVVQLVEQVVSAAVVEGGLLVIQEAQEQEVQADLIQVAQELMPTQVV